MKGRVKVGLEWHQRLRTRKLFCYCPGNISQEPEQWVKRYLRIASSELGELDPAAAVEAARGRTFKYGFSNDSSCLVELDESPPFPLNEEALKIALRMTMYFRMMAVDEVRVMRKTVIDGSNTSGFQRTLLLALGTPDSYIDTRAGRVGLQSLCLEEESAFIIKRDESDVSYRLDRLAIPLVELATAPDISSPEQAEEVAEEVGLMMRLTGDVQRGLGTIRQDINISVEGGSRQEIKGVQDLRLIPRIVEYEAQRQAALLDIREELMRRGTQPSREKVINLNNVLKHSGSKVISTALSAGGVVLGTKLPKFGGLLGKEIQPGRRFGTELADYARVWGGVGGLMHSDEFPKYGIEESDVQAVNEALGTAQDDAFVLVVGPQERSIRGINAVHQRALVALSAVPSETRKPNEDGTTTYMRPLPGPSRMYPETDIPPVPINEQLLAEFTSKLPPSPAQKLDQFRKMGLTMHMADQMLRSPVSPVFEEAVSEGADPVFSASVILNVMPHLRRESIEVDRIADHEVKNLLVSFGNTGLPKEAVENVLRSMATGASLEESYKEFSGQVIDEKELREMVSELVRSRHDLINHSTPEHAHKALMGLLMSQLRGRASGSLASKILWDAIQEVK